MIEKKYSVTLQTKISKSFRVKMACDSLDIDINKKSTHNLVIDNINLDYNWNVGLIVGSSGSGKTTLAKEIFGQNCFIELLNLSLPVIEQFPDDMTYHQCADILCGIGLTSVPCWVRPAHTLSNGQKARAEAALQMIQNREISVIDEWTSVVDRKVGKIMSHCIQKFSRKNGKKVILLSCHYDVMDWLNPDFVIDCNEQKFHPKLKKKEKIRYDSILGKLAGNRGNILANITI